MKSEVPSKTEAEHKVIVCTTFREFNDSENSRIQNLFLNSILGQTNDNYHLVVTVFGEKNVKPILSDMFGEKCSFFDEHLEGYRYSLSSVLLNGIKVSESCKDSIVLWCTCDIILPENFFEVIVKLYTKDLVGSSFPNLIAKNVKSFHEGKFRFGSYYGGIDILFFANNLLCSEPILSILKRYYFYDWGAWEFFLSGIGLKASGKLINLLGLCDIRKIENDRAANNETKAFLSESNKRNFQTIKRSIVEAGLAPCTAHPVACLTKFKLQVIPVKFVLSMGLINTLKTLINTLKTICKQLIKAILRGLKRLLMSQVQQ